MPEIVTSPLNLNNILYGTGTPDNKNIGSACVDGKGEVMPMTIGKTVIWHLAQVACAVLSVLVPTG